MSAVCIMDTTVFCELLAVPGKSNAVDAHQKQMREKVTAREVLLLPMTTILETGNHIGQVADGGRRRQVAERFVAMVEAAVCGAAPFETTPLFDDKVILGLLKEFPNWVGRQSGFGDLTIYREWEEQCARNPRRRVYIWSNDQDLQGYDREP